MHSAVKILSPTLSPAGSPDYARHYAEFVDASFLVRLVRPLADIWTVPESELEAIVGVSFDNLDELPQDKSIEVKERLTGLLQVAANLRALYAKAPEMADVWLHQKNFGPYFEGARPWEVLKAPAGIARVNDVLHSALAELRGA